MKTLFLGISLLLGTGLAAAHAETRFSSGPQQTALLELYTSEGCSSCPPAEARLSQLKDNPGLWKQFVPVAFHVDYWDRLGWRDRFSSKDFTDRQSSYAALWRSDSVYTPAFVLNGKESREWSSNLTSPNDPAGRLSAESKDGKTWTIEFRPTANSPGGWDVHLALLGGGISSKIGGGENGGRNLQHDFVVLNEQTTAMKTEGDHAAASLTMNSSSENVPQKAVAVWVSRRGQLPPVQATGGWLAAR